MVPEFKKYLLTCLAIASGFGKYNILNKKYCKSIFFLIVFISFLAEITAAKTVDEINNIEIYRKASPGVVNISSVVVEYDFFYRPIPKEGSGSGVIIDKLGHIITNNHVIQDSQRLEVTLYDGSKTSAILVGTDPGYDLAVIKITCLSG